MLKKYYFFKGSEGLLVQNIRKWFLMFCNIK